jgi:hypothetical protein
MILTCIIEPLNCIQAPAKVTAVSQPKLLIAAPAGGGNIVIKDVLIAFAYLLPQFGLVFLFVPFVVQHLEAKPLYEVSHLLIYKEGCALDGAHATGMFEVAARSVVAGV